MLSINTNLSSLIAQNSLTTSTNKLNQAIERMTTGFKINHAKDNAANYSIATNLTTKIGAYMVAEDNCAMGLDMLATANGSLDQISDKLSRLRILAEQASNGTYGEQSLKAINAEANALVDEINRLYSTAEYNGRKLFAIDRSIPSNVGVQRTADYGEFISNPETYTVADVEAMTRVKDVSTFSSGQKYAIYTKEELEKLRDYVNSGNDTSNVEFVLGADIDLSSIENWYPIGDTTTLAFKGVFDGNGHVVKNLKIDRTNPKTGLFGHSDGELKNIGLENVNIKGKNNVGALAGYTGANVTNCYSTGVIKAENYVGGLVGSPYADIIDSSSSCYVTGVNNVGGLSGSAEGGFVNCYTDGYVAGNSVVAGISGFSRGAVINCSSNATVVSDDSAAGLFYKAFSNISNCVFNGSVKGVTNVSGILGYSAGTENVINNCYVLGKISGVENVAGIVANYYSYGGDLTIENCTVNADIANGGIALGLFNDRGLGAYNLIINNISTVQADAPIVERYQLNGSDNNTYDLSQYDVAKNIIDMTKDLICLQVGINSDENSQIMLQGDLKIDNYNIFRYIGVSDLDFISNIDATLATVSAKNSEYGAIQNRLESALDEISTQYENLVSTRSTIRDADIAEVSSEYIRQQILQQASATLMSTANQSPSIALQLI